MPRYFNLQNLLWNWIRTRYSPEILKDRLLFSVLHIVSGMIFYNIAKLECVAGPEQDMFLFKISKYFE